MRTMNRAALLLSLLACGCLSLGESAPPAERLYDVLPPTPTADVVRPGPAAAPMLYVAPFTADAALTRDELVWRRGPVETGAYADHRWARPPAEAARSFLAAALRQADDLEVRIAAEPPPPDPELLLTGHLERFDELDGEDRWFGVVELHLALMQRDGQQELWRRVYRRELAAPERNPLAVVAALRQGLSEVAADAIADLRVELRSVRAEGPGG